MIVGCYCLQLYCQNYMDAGQEGVNDPIHEFREFPREYTHEYGSRCRAMAKRDGWKLNRKAGIAICPKCNRAPLPTDKKQV